MRSDVFAIARHGCEPGLAASVRGVVQAIDPQQSVEHITTPDRMVRDTTAEQRFYSVRIEGFALVAVRLSVAAVAGVGTTDTRTSCRLSSPVGSCEKIKI